MKGKSGKKGSKSEYGFFTVSKCKNLSLVVRCETSHGTKL